MSRRQERTSRDEVVAGWDAVAGNVPGGYPAAVEDRAAPFAHVLHPETIERLARGAALTRGQAYVAQGRVGTVTKKDGQLVAVVRGTTLYAVSIWVAGDSLGYTCSCPAGTEGDFCKHCVAVAIVWLEVSPA